MIGKWLLIVIFSNGHWGSGVSTTWFENQAQCEEAKSFVTKNNIAMQDPKMFCKDYSNVK
jgi:hypothetical protein